VAGHGAHLKKKKRKKAVEENVISKEPRSPYESVPTEQSYDILSN